MKVSEKIFLDGYGLMEHGPINIVILGDSVSHGSFNGYNDYENVYWNVLKKKLNQFRDYVPVNMINASIGGTTATHALGRLENQVFCHQPDLVIVCYGLNDVNGTLEEYLDSMRKIFSRCLAANTDAIFLTPNMLNTYVADDTPAEHWEYAHTTAQMQTSGKMDEFIASAIDLANSMGIPVCDCYSKWKKLAETEDTTLLLSNRINHPTAQMHQLFADSLYDLIMADVQDGVESDSTMYRGTSETGKAPTEDPVANYTPPIAKENFPEFWSHVWRKYGQAKRSFLIGKLIGVIGELVFLLSMLLITIGGIYAAEIPVVNNFLDSLPVVMPLWKQLLAIPFVSQLQTPVQVALAFGAVYGVSIGVCIVIAVLVYALYHPIAKKPCEDIRQNADILAQKAHQALSFSSRAKSNLSTTCAILFLVLLGALLTAVILVNLENGNPLEEISAVFPINNMVVLIVGVFALFCGYSVLDTVFMQVVQWLFYCKVPYSLLADADRFQLFSAEDVQDADDGAVAAKRLAEADIKCKNALELEKSGEYARAKILFHEAALAGDVSAMDHYARHCIIVRHNNEAIHWLQCCVDTGKADTVTEKRLKDLKRGRHISLKYYS